MKITKFLITKAFWKNFGLAIGLTVVLYLFVFLVLRIYTHHGQALDVPNISGMTIEEAQKTLKKSRMRMEIVDSVFNSMRPKGTIIEQNPLPGFKVKKKRRIFVVTNAFNPEKVQMPGIVGVSLRQAKVMVKNAGLEIGKLIYKRDIAKNNVLEQHYNGEPIEEGDLIAKGSQIDLILGKGLSNERAPLPDLYEYKLDDAKDRLIRSALNLGAVIYDESIENYEDSINARVWRQYPKFKEGKTAQLGSTVDLWISVDSIRFVKDTVKINISELDE